MTPRVEGGSYSRFASIKLLRRVWDWLDGNLVMYVLYILYHNSLVGVANFRLPQYLLRTISEFAMQQLCVADVPCSRSRGSSYVLYLYLCTFICFMSRWPTQGGGGGL